MTLLSLPLHRQPGHGPARRLFDITLRGNQARIRCRRRRRRPTAGPKARTRRSINRAKRTIRRCRSTPPSGPVGRGSCGPAGPTRGMTSGNSPSGRVMGAPVACIGISVGPIPRPRAPSFCRDVGSSESDSEGGQGSVWVAGLAAERGGDVDRPGPAGHADDQVVQGCHDAWAGSRSSRSPASSASCTPAGGGP
jgi:hypothetical protein